MMPVPGVSKRGGQQIILLPSNAVSDNPGDGETVFLGALGPSNDATVSSIYVKRACRITEVRHLAIAAGTLGTAEDATSSVRVNNTTDTTISSVVEYDEVSQRFDNTALNVPLAAGDFFCIKIVYPTFATNPTGVFNVFEVILE